jgi:hypothetical protein
MHALHEGIWLGLLDRHLLNEVTRAHYQGSRIYAARDHNLSGLRPWERSAVERFFNGRSSILVGAAGGGREMLALLRGGFQVDAFECTPDLVTTGEQLVREQGYSGKFIACAADRVPSECGRYDAALVGCGAYSHMAGRATRVAFLRELRSHVRSGGPILLSFFVRYGAGRARAAAAVARWIRRLRRSNERVELGDMLHGGGFEHWFSEAEIRDEMNAAGLSVDYYSEDPLGHLVARAVG